MGAGRGSKWREEEGRSGKKTGGKQKQRKYWGVFLNVAYLLLVPTPASARKRRAAHAVEEHVHRDSIHVDAACGHAAHPAWHPPTHALLREERAEELLRV